jgi:hypothetical protein
MSDEIHDIYLLKRLAKAAEHFSQGHMIDNPHYKAAYNQIAKGTALLWRLIEQSGPTGKPELAVK